MSQAVFEVLETIEYGGIVWNAVPKINDDGIQYRAYQAGGGDFRIYQYPLDKGSSCAGEWLWEAKLYILVQPIQLPSHIDMEIRHLAPTREEAMQCCLEAKGKFVEQVIMLAQLFGAKKRDVYEAAYFEGKKAGKEEVIKAIKESML